MTTALNPDTAASDRTPPKTPAPGSRNARGQFAPGNPGGPGRPPKITHIEREVLAYIAHVMDPELWMLVTEAMARQAIAGNVAAANWLTRTILSGKLSQAAAADAVGITREAEMLILGKSQHPEWARLLDERLAAEHAREAAPPSPAIPVPAIPAQPATAARPEVGSLYRLETEETVKSAATKTVETAGESSPVAAASAPSAVRPAPPPAAPRPLTVPPSERVHGFRVTKGPRPPETRHKRSKTAAPSASAPATAVIR